MMGHDSANINWFQAKPTMALFPTILLVLWIGVRPAETLLSPLGLSTTTTIIGQQRQRSECVAVAGAVTRSSLAPRIDERPYHPTKPTALDNPICLCLWKRRIYDGSSGGDSEHARIVRMPRPPEGSTQQSTRLFLFDAKQHHQRRREDQQPPLEAEERTKLSRSPSWVPSLASTSSSSSSSRWTDRGVTFYRSKKFFFGANQIPAHILDDLASPTVQFPYRIPSSPFLTNRALPQSQLETSSRKAGNKINGSSDEQNKQSLSSELSSSPTHLTIRFMTWRDLAAITDMCVKQYGPAALNPHVAPNSHSNSKNNFISSSSSFGWTDVGSSSPSSSMFAWSSPSWMNNESYISNVNKINMASLGDWLDQICLATLVQCSMFLKGFWSTWGENGTSSNIPADHAVLVACLDDEQHVQPDLSDDCNQSSQPRGEVIVGMMEVSRQPVVPQRNPPLWPVPLLCKRAVAYMTTGTPSLQGWITNVLVAPQYRGCGVATILLAASEGVANTWNCQSMHLHCDADSQRQLGRAAQRLYQRMGYQPGDVLIGDRRNQKNSNCSSTDWTQGAVRSSIVFIDEVPSLYLTKQLLGKAKTEQTT